MTREELVNNISFRSVVREMKKKYPYMTYIGPGKEFEEDSVNYETFYTIDSNINTEKFLETYPQFSIYKTYLSRLEREGSLSSIMWDVVDTEEGADFNVNDLRDEINDTLEILTENIRALKIIPDEYQLDRNLYLSRYIFK